MAQQKSRDTQQQTQTGTTRQQSAGSSQRAPAGAAPAGGREVSPVQVQQFLKGMDYPASREGLIECARGNGADQDVLDALQQLPARQFATPADVSQALGGQS